MAKDSPNLGKQALNKVVEIGITTQLDRAEEIDVDIQTNPVNLLQGKLDSVEIAGKGLVVKQDLRVEAIEIGTDEVAINPLSAVFGKIELTHPTDAEARIVLTEADINHAFSCEYIRTKLQGLKMGMAGQPVTIDIQTAELTLPGDNQFTIAATFLMREQNQIKKISATAIPQIDENGNRISLEILAAQGEGLTLKLVMAIFEQLSALLDLRNFNLPGVSLQLHQLEAQAGRLIIHARSRIAAIPAV
jgi:LmeA-like phospholipid-binding